MWRWVCIAAAAELRQQRHSDNAANAESYTIAGGHTSLEKIVGYVKEQAPVDYALCGDGFAEANAQRVKQTLARYPHARLVPEDLLLEYVAPFTVLDEPRTAPAAAVAAPAHSDHKPQDAGGAKLAKHNDKGGKGGAKLAKHDKGAKQSLLEQEPCDAWWQDPRLAKLAEQPEVEQFARDLTPTRDVAAYVAKSLQGLLGLHFHGDDTPKYMSVHDILGSKDHEASCTGMSIVYVNALRLLGVPARVAGTPAWNGDEKNGNHNWVEAYVCNTAEGDECEWAFFDALEPLEEDRCKNWFCTHSKLGASSNTKVFAARFEKTPTAFPLAWATDAQLGDKGVYGEDRTIAYARLCGPCADQKNSFLQRAASYTAAELEAARDHVEKAVAEIEQEVESAAAAAAVDAAGAGHI